MTSFSRSVFSVSLGTSLRAIREEKNSFRTEIEVSKRSLCSPIKIVH